MISIIWTSQQSILFLVRLYDQLEIVLSDMYNGQILTAGCSVFRFSQFIEPRLSKEITQITYPVYWKGNLLEIQVNHEHLKVKNKGTETIIFSNGGGEYQMTGNTGIELSGATPKSSL